MFPDALLSPVLKSHSDTYHRIEYCPTCNQGIEYFTSDRSDGLSCIKCGTKQTLFYQADARTTIEDYEAVKEELYEFIKSKEPGHMEELDFSPLQAFIEEQTSTISDMQDEIDALTTRIEELEDELSEMTRDRDDRDNALEKIKSLADDYV